MPHLVLEYSVNSGFDAEQQLDALHECLSASGCFREADIKIRVCPPFADYRVGGKTDAAFVHATLLLMAGRSEACKRQLAENIAAVLKDNLTAERAVEITVRPSDIDPQTYCKIYL